MKKEVKKHKKYIHKKTQTKKELSIMNANFKHKYNITLKEYNEMLLYQNYKCMICNTHQKDLTKKLSVDHCHITGIIRGLLCTNCNVGLGLLQDNAEVIKNALKYLRKTQPNTKL